MTNDVGYLAHGVGELDPDNYERQMRRIHKACGLYDEDYKDDPYGICPDCGEPLYPDSPCPCWNDEA